MSEQFSLDRARYMNNVLKGNQLNETIDRILNDLLTTLEQYCGPNRGMAALFSTTVDGRKVAKFTKDGVNIIKNIQYANPVDQHIHTLFEYVGKGLENKAGDGTTSAMMLTAYVVREMRRLSKEQSYVYQELVTAFNQFYEQMVDALSKIAILPKDGDTELINAIAYHQAMTSSHGNVKLSKLVAELLSGLPKRAWECLIYHEEMVETDTTYKLLVDDSSYSFMSNVMDGRMYNSETGNRIEHERCTLLVAPHELTTESACLHDLTTRIEKHKKEDDPLLIILAQPSGMAYNTIHQLYAKKRGEGCEQTVMFVKDLISSNVNDLTAIYAICGVNSTLGESTEMLEKGGIRYQYRNGRSYLYGLVEYGPDKIHPDAYNTSTPVGSLLRNCKAYLEMYENDQTDRNASYIVKRIRAIQNSVEFSGIGTVVIGGPLYEQQAARDVLEDVLSACRESVTRGVLLGGYRSLAKVLDTNFYEDGNPVFLTPTQIQEMTQKYFKDSTLVNNNILKFSKRSTEQVELCYNQVLKEGIIVPQLVNVVANALLFLDAAICNQEEYVECEYMGETSFDVLSGQTCVFNEDNLKNLDNRMILQSLTSYTEWLKRLADIGPKLIGMDSAILPNAFHETKHKIQKSGLWKRIRNVIWEQP